MVLWTVKMIMKLATQMGIMLILLEVTVEILMVMQFYLDICAVLYGLLLFARILHEARFYLFDRWTCRCFKKSALFRTCFQGGHYHVLWTGPYQVIVLAHAFTHK